MCLVFQVPLDFTDEEFFKLVLEKKAVHSLVETPYYSLFVDFLLKERENNGSQEDSSVNQAISQLRSAGLAAEAGTLLARSRNTHSSLATIDTAIQTLKNWMRR